MRCACFFLASMLLLVLFSLGWVTFTRGDVAAQTGSNDAEHLHQLLTNCEHPCFMGIEVDVTTKADALNILNSMSAEVYFYDGSPEQSEVWSWIPEPQQFVNDGTHPDSDVVLTFQGDILKQISLPLEVSLSTVIEAFGAPDGVRSSPSNTESNQGYYLVYEDERLVFTVTTLFGTDTTVVVFLISSVNESNMIDNPIGVEVLQSCLDYGIPPCIAATATPLPLSPTTPPTLTLAPQATQLRQPTTCSHTSFLSS